MFSTYIGLVCDFENKYLFINAYEMFKAHFYPLRHFRNK